LQYHSCISLKGLSEVSKYLSQTSQPPGCDLNVARPKENFWLPPIEMRTFLVSVWVCLLTKSFETNQHHRDAAEAVWLTYNGHTRECAHTSTVESCRGPRVLPSQQYWCRMFHFRQSSFSGQAWRLVFFAEEWIEKLVLLVKEKQAIYDASHCDYRNISSRSGHKWLNIPNSSLFTFTGWTRIFRLLRPNLRLHIIACKTSRLKFSVVVGFFTCALFKNGTTWIRAGVSRLNFI